jgi:hypothetical protein
MRNTSKIGQVSVAQIICALSNLGKYIYLPFGDHYRSDLVIEDEDGQFSRIQCKTARLVRGTASELGEFSDMYFDGEAGIITLQ